MADDFKHAHRATLPDGRVECECGEQFDDDQEWQRSHSDWTPEGTDDDEA